MEIKVGVCKTCKFYFEEWFDPSPPGVALSPGCMLDAGCSKEDELAELNMDISNIGIDEEHQCPLWQPNLQWCVKHKKWYMFECKECLKDMDV
ncbi:MAG: hypothetical protein DRP55_04190 [Spirochaetes bacterium]|nr:MAG: hypothetical protein DRP55_04190 [Spirochaetota bacterium]